MIAHADCREFMAELEPNSVDAIICDPPYELGFMGKRWDGSGIAYDPAVWTQALRVLKPGGHLLAFGGTRTFHRLAVAIEDAGFEIRDCLMWLYGSGFPKSHNLGNGWGTALKPAWEPIIMARKPLIGTVIANVEQYGTGALNIDGCRIGTDETITNHARSSDSAISKGIYGSSTAQETHQTAGQALGRWPANLILDEEAAAMLDEQTGERKGGAFPRKQNEPPGTGRTMGNGWSGAVAPARDMGDTGGASRFFYTAKASRAERNAGLEGLPERERRSYEGGPIVSADHPDTSPGGHTQPAKNHHPTVKPISLMRHLVRLVTPPGGVVLDPFAGSGSTGCAVALESNLRHHYLGEEPLTFIGCDTDAEYVEIANRRIAYWSKADPREHTPRNKNTGPQRRVKRKKVSEGMKPLFDMQEAT